MIRVRPSAGCGAALRALSLALCGLAATSATRAATGEPVVEVELRSDVPLAHAEELTALIAIPRGEPLAPGAVRQTLRNLQAAGVASEIEVRELAAPGGTRVVVALWANVRVESVELSGELGLKPERLREVILVREAEALIEDRVVRSVYALQDLYRAQGYLKAEVKIDVQTDPLRKTAAVVFRCTANQRATVGTIAFEAAALPFSQTELEGGLDSRPGGRYLAQTVREDPDRLRTWLVRKGYRLAEVDTARETVSADSTRVDLAFPVRLGPRIEFELEGADLKRLRKRNLLPFLSDDGYDEALVVQSIDLIRRDYQARGYYHVTIDRHDERTADVMKLRFSVDPGTVYTLEEVAFTGNTEISSDRLQELATTNPRRLLRPGSGRLIDEVLKEDLANLRSFYALSGYSAAKVGPEKVEETGDRLRVEVPIVEGPRTTLSKLRFEGLASIPESKVRPQLPLVDGGAYHPLLLDDTVNAVRSLYQDEGWEAAQVSPVVSWNADHSQAEVTLQIFEGPQSRVDRIVVRGYRKTRPEVVRRSIELDPGEPVSPRRLLEVQRGLYRLGIFSRVDVETAHTGEDVAQRDVLVRLEEGRMQRYSYGLGYDSDDGLRGLIGYSHANLFGRALGLQLDARASQREDLFRALLRQPYVGRFDVPVTYSIFYTEEEREGFNSQRRGTQVEAARVINDVRYGLLYNYRIVDVELPGDGGAPPPEIERDLQNIRISSLTPSMLIDHRDDPINATRGWSGAAQLEWASPLLSAEEAFLKFFVQSTWQRAVGRGGVFAASARVGAIEPLSDAAPPDPSLPPGFESAEIPISERFFAGGRTTNRAYARDLLGIRGQTLCAKGDPNTPSCLAEGDDEDDFDPIGGDGLAVANIEYRFTIAGGVGGSAFLDVGNVWPRWQDIDPSQAKIGVGVGVRYLSPIGPLRLEVGWKLDREPGESPYEIFLSFGNPF